MDHSPLFETGQIGGLTLKNRVIKSPQTTALSNQDGTVSARTVKHYQRLAEGGPGLVMVEYSYVDDDAAKSIHAQIGISRREHIPGLGWLADTVHAAGAKVGLQLVHTGRQKFLGVAPIKSSSDVSWDYVEGQFGCRPTPMTCAEIDGVVEAFGDAAQRVVRANFDIVEIHAGHGYLITNFLSPHVNRRTDDYGGSFENRARLLLRIVANVRQKVPVDFPVSVRVSVVDYEADGITIAETVALCRLLEQAGVDVIHASGGHHARMEYEVSPWFMPRTPHRWGWEQIKAAVGIPVIGSGSIVSPDNAAEIVASGSADFVSLGRPMLADPDWTRKTLENRVAEIVPCIRCNDGCLHRGLNVGRSTGCAVNPSMGHEYSFPVLKAERPIKVAVVGGGPAGLKAAITLFDKGHAVTLYEVGALGGRLVEASRSPLREDLRALLDHLIHEFKRRTIELVSSAATARTLGEGRFDRILLATGVRPQSLDTLAFTGKLLSPVDIEKSERLQGPIVIVGGGIVGCDIALRLHLEGCGDITLVEKRAALLADDDVFTDQIGLPVKLAEAGIITSLQTEALACDGASVTLQNVADGGISSIAARNVIVAVGHRVNRELFDALDAPSRARSEFLGTAREGRRVMDALHDAFFVANRI